MSPSSSRVWSPQLFLSKEGNQHGTRTFYCKSSSASTLNCPQCQPVGNGSDVFIFNVTDIDISTSRPQRILWNISTFHIYTFLILSFETDFQKKSFGFLVNFLGSCYDMICLFQRGDGPGHGAAAGGVGEGHALGQGHRLLLVPA